MIWKLLAIIFCWLLCGAWAIRMGEKNENEVERDSIWCYYLFGLLFLAIEWFGIWPSRIRKFRKGTVAVWRETILKKPARDSDRL